MEIMQKIKSVNKSLNNIHAYNAVELKHPKDRCYIRISLVCLRFFFSLSKGSNSNAIPEKMLTAEKVNKYFGFYIAYLGLPALTSYPLGCQLKNVCL